MEPYRVTSLGARELARANDTYDQAGIELAGPGQQVDGLVKVPHLGRRPSPE